MVEPAATSFYYHRVCIMTQWARSPSVCPSSDRAIVQSARIEQSLQHTIELGSYSGLNIRFRLPDWRGNALLLHCSWRFVLLNSSSRACWNSLFAFAHFSLLATVSMLSSATRNFFFRCPPAKQTNQNQNQDHHYGTKESSQSEKLHCSDSPAEQ